VFEFQRLATPMFFVLIFISSFGIVNVIIGVIVESTNASMAQLEENKNKIANLMKMRHIQHLTEVIWNADSDGDGIVTLSELHEAAEDPEICEELRDMGLPKGFTFEDFHTMLNLDGRDGLDRTEFVDGMHRLIFSNEFQKACLLQLGIGQVKVVAQQLSDLGNNRMDFEFRRLRRQNRKMKAKLLSAIRGRRPRTRGPGAATAPEGEDLDNVSCESDDTMSSSSASDLETNGRQSRARTNGRQTRRSFRFDREPDANPHTPKSVSFDRDACVRHLSGEDSGNVPVTSASACSSAALGCGRPASLDLQQVDLSAVEADVVYDVCAAASSAPPFPTEVPRPSQVKELGDPSDGCFFFHV